MSDFQTCYAFAKGNEDAEGKCADVVDPVPVRPNDSDATADLKKNARAISGVNSYYHPDAYQTILKIPQEDREPAVELFFKSFYWNQWLEAILSNEISERVFDANVNQGSGVLFLQEAINSLGGSQVPVDDVMGPVTAAAANAVDEGALLAAFRTIREDDYRRRAERDKTPPNILAAWLARAAK